jgi:ribosome biogenesis GTPase / thiamine phosphate phosphatase
MVLNKMKTQFSLKDLGYDEFFESNRKKLKLDGFEIARVITEYKEAYKVKNENGEYLGKITGKQIFNASSREDYPAVGDWVAITVPDSEHAVIHKFFPRKTIIKRKQAGKNETQIIASNIDVAFVVQAVDNDYSLNRFERYFAIVKDGGVKPAIILNKTDLASKEELESKSAEIKDRFSDVDFILASIVTNDGLEKLESYMQAGKTYCFLGSSGVGKSSLINKLIGQEILKTKEINIGTDRGKHTTTRREMFFLENGSIVVDNPGMREVGMSDNQAGIDNSFDEIRNLAKGCKYPDCTHTREPGCQVLLALASGKINESQYSNYIDLKKEAEYYRMTKLEKREKDKQFGKFIKRSMDDLRKID